MDNEVFFACVKRAGFVLDRYDAARAIYRRDGAENLLYVYSLDNGKVTGYNVYRNSECREVVFCSQPKEYNTGINLERFVEKVKLHYGG